MFHASPATKDSVPASAQALPPRPVAALRLRGAARVVEALVAWPPTIADEPAMLLLFADRRVRPAALTDLAARANAVVTFAPVGSRDALSLADARCVATWIATHPLALDARPDQLTVGALGATMALRTATAAVEHVRADALPEARGPVRFVIRGDSIHPAGPASSHSPAAPPASTAESPRHHTKGTDMHHVISADGSRIAFDRRGSGEPVILVDGALCSRQVGPSADTAKALSEEFTVVNYDRRGRGDSTDESAGRFEVEREIDDLAALVDHLGGAASLVGFSSGGGLAIEAAGRIRSIRRVVAYEVPYITDPAHAVPPDYAARLRELVEADQRSDAVRYFLGVVGMPGPLIAVMRLTPPFRKLKRVAHTLPYDAAIIVDAIGPDRVLEPERWATIRARVSVLAGAKSPAPMRRANAELAAVLGADHAELDGLTHMVKGRAVAPAFAERLRAPVASK